METTLKNTNNNKKRSSVDIGIGYEHDIAGLFQFGENGPALVEAITFVFSQTLQRDMFFGSWAQAYRNGNGEYRVIITSPTDDVSAYQTLIPNYIKAGKQAIASYYKNVPYPVRKGWEFLLPFGLAMANIKSIQLLHFPPLETFTYKDYLYSPTNRRWECLLAQNNFNGVNNTPIERIIDVAPIAAPGGAGKELTDYNQDFIPYVKAQLKNFLRPLQTTNNKLTQPIIAYGGPVHDWLKQAYSLNKTPKTLDIIKLNIIDGNSADDTPYTWVLCANHPSEYLYDTDIPLKDANKPNGDYPAPMVVMCQDLVAAGWQAHMSENPNDDPYKTLSMMEDRWGWDPENHKVKADKVETLLAIMKEQNQAFNLNNNSFTPTLAQATTNTFALQRNRTSDNYTAYAIDITAKDIFCEVLMDKDAKFDEVKRLLQAGGYLIDWAPPISDHDVIEYRVIKYDRNSSNPLAEKTLTYGKWPKDKFFSNYRPNYGASFAQIELIGFPGYVLSIIPSQGRRSYQLWNFDPLAEDDCLSVGQFQSGGFRDIGADRELYPIGNYVLDRKGANYRVWSFDPQSTPPLALPTVQDGNWTNIDETDAMTVLGAYIITWKPTNLSAGCQIWLFDANQTNPLGNQPIKTSTLPTNFEKNTYLFGVIPNTPEVQTTEKTPEPPPGTIDFMRQKIEHVVYYMVESRSFDNVVGWLYEKGKKEGLNWVGNNDDGFRGLDTSMSNTLPNGEQAFVSQYKGGKLSNNYILGGPAQDPWHDNSDVLLQMFYGYEGYKNRVQPTMNGFAWNQNSAAVMTSFSPEQLPVLNGLGKHFALSDDWFSSLPGGTDVNRGFSVSGSAYNRLGTWEGGDAYQDWPDQAHRQSLWKVLWNHGHQDWKIYYNVIWDKAVFTYQLYLKGQIQAVDEAWNNAVLQEKGTNNLPNSTWVSPLKQFYDDIKYDKLPRFSYIEPAWVGESCTSYHPGSSSSEIASIVPAERALNEIYEALNSNSEVWSKTLLVVTFDKNGGLFDHISPPYTNKPWPNDVTDGFEFDIKGPRVPAIFVSPWIKPNTIMRAENEQGFDSTSFAATLLDWYGIARGTWGMGDRIDKAPTIEGVLNEEKIREIAPKLSVPYDKNNPKET